MFALIAAMIAVAIPYADRTVQRDRSLRQAVGWVLLAHQITAFLQVALSGLPTMKMDPLVFHSFATHGEGHMARNFYAQLLHTIYNTFGASHLLGCQISNIFFSLALLTQIHLLRHLGYKTSIPKLILLFGLLPSCVLNTSVTLREAAQMFCFLAITLLLLKTCRKGLEVKTFLIFPIALLFINLHQGMAALLLVLIPFSLAFSLQARPAILVALSIASLSGGVVLKDRILNELREKSAVVQNLSEGNITYLEQYATRVNDSRTNFGTTLDISSVSRALQTGPVILVYYLFSPLPWQVRGLLDLYGIVESLIRISLFYYGIRALRQSSPLMRRELILLALLYFMMEIGWAIGTANWGTAFRHRVVAWGLLVGIGGAIFGELPNSATPPKTMKKHSVRENRRRLRRG